MNKLDRCFFCDKIIIPFDLTTTGEIIDFFTENKIDYTLNYSKSKFKIGNKIICLLCEDDFRNVANYAEECQCDECKKHREFKERFGC